MPAPSDPTDLLTVWIGQIEEGLKLRYLSAAWDASNNQAKYWSKLLKQDGLIICRGKRWYLSVDGWLLLEQIHLP
jgi:hypothetical protein